MYKNKTKQQANSSFKKTLNEFRTDFKLEWKTIKEQFGIDMHRFGRFLKKLLITDKK